MTQTAKATHTPGPWYFHDDGFVYSEDCDTNGTPYRIASPHCDAGPDPDEREANARVIAAACNSYDKHCGPRAVECAEDDLLGELLETLRESKEFVEHYFGHKHELATTRNGVGIHYRKLCATIAKAKEATE